MKADGMFAPALYTVADDVTSQFQQHFFRLFFFFFLYFCLTVDLIQPLAPYHLLNVPSDLPSYTDGVTVAQT